jgi:hypothetical protein
MLVHVLAAEVAILREDKKRQYISENDRNESKM